MILTTCCCGAAPDVTPIACPATVFDLPDLDSRRVQVPSWSASISGVTEYGPPGCPSNPRYLTFTGTFSSLEFNPSDIYGAGSSLAGVASSSQYVVLSIASACWESDGTPFSDPDIVALHPDSTNDYAIVGVGYEYDKPGISDTDACDRILFDNGTISGLAGIAWYVSPQPWNSDNGGDFPTGVYSFVFATINGELVTGSPPYEGTYCFGGQSLPDCAAASFTPPTSVTMVTN